MNGMWFIVSGLFSLVTQSICGLHSYYLHFPPPIIPVLNRIDSDYPQPIWPQNLISNSTITRTASNFPSGPIPLILHTWVKPDASEGTRLDNGSVVYYIGGPWGGIRTETPASTQLPPKPSTMSNFIDTSTESFNDRYPLPDRAALLQRLPQQVGNSVGWETPSVAITAPPSRHHDGSWGQKQGPASGYGWDSTTQPYDKAADITTSETPTHTRSQNATTRLPSTSTSAAPPEPTSPVDEATTEDPVAANTNARFPVSESVRKFRRIVAQIRAITKKELTQPTKPPARKSKRDLSSRLL